MASLVTQLLGGGLLQGISSLINTIRGKSPEDAAKLEQIALKYQSDLLAADLQMQQAQIDVNKVEAASPDKFTSRWRPTIGYVCAGAFAVNYVLVPLGTWIASMFGLSVKPLELDMATMLPVLMGLLGLGGYRSWEKVKGATK